MRPFDWESLLREERIEHIERGPNVKRGELNVKCPFCGNADPSFHMGLSLSTGFWACWRNSQHRGKSPLRLLMRLMRIPYWKAREMAGLDDSYVDPEGFDAAVARIMGRDTSITRMEQVRKDFLPLPAEFDLIKDKGRSRRHFDYLWEDRGFGHSTPEVIDDYLLMCAVRGRDSNRVIFPYITNGELVSWSGRAIGPATLRYLDLPLEDCLIPPKENLYNHDAITKPGKALVVVEGPMDTLKVDHFGKHRGVRAVGLSTNSMTDEQMYQLEEAADNFDRLVFMMDQKSSSLGVVDSMFMRQKVGHIKNAELVEVPFGCKDAGMFTPAQADLFITSILGD